VRRSSPGRTPSSRTPSSRTSPPRSSASGQDRYAAFVQSVIERYDKNDDGFLDKGESTPLREEFIDYDLDEDGKLTADELMKYYMKRIER
jgi:Ca2+-binding EF-hand superfamily protein